ncbi:MAG: hypothetical protein AB1298_08710 [Bacteroidota bacterium]
MKSSLTISVILLFGIIIGCKKETVTGPNQPQNLIANSSFETNGNPTIAGWQFRDSAIFNFAEDAPPGGGNYSVVLVTFRPSSFSMNALIVKVPLAIGSHQYKLSVWARRESNGQGFISLFRHSGDIDTMTAFQSLVITDTVWSYYSTQMNLTNSTNDSVVVALNGGYAPISYLDSRSFFDLCKLEQLN